MSQWAGAANGAEEELRRKLWAMEEENTRLRNSVMTYNDEIFTLRAVAATVEAELKFATDQEIQKIGSELKFRDKELNMLSRDHERVLKELAQLKQQEQSNRMMTQANAHLNSNRVQPNLSTGAGKVQEAPSTESILHSPRSSQSLALPASSQHPVPSVVSVDNTEGSLRPQQPMVVATGQRQAPPSTAATTVVSPRSSLAPARISVKSAAEPVQQRGSLSRLVDSCFQMLLADILAFPQCEDPAERQGAIARAAGSLRSAQLETSGAAAALAFFRDALSLAEHLLQEARKHLGQRRGAQAADTSYMRVLDSAVLLLHSACSALDSADPSLCAERNYNALLPLHEEGGNLQRKFDRVASAAQAGAKASAATTPGVLITAAIRAPALSESQCLAAWSRHHPAHSIPGEKSRGSGSQPVETLMRAAWRFAGLLSQMLALVASQAHGSHDGEVSEHSAAVLKLLCSCGEAGATLFRLPVLSLPPTRVSEDHYAGCVLQALSAMETILDRDALLGLAALNARWSLAHMFECLVTSSGRAFSEFAGLETKPSADKTTRGILGSLVTDLACDLRSATVAEVYFRCQVVQSLLRVLSQHGGRFVKVLLGLPENTSADAQASQGNEKATAGGKRGRASDAVSDTASTCSSSSSAQGAPEPAAATPLHPKKIHRGGRAESVVQGASAVGASALVGAAHGAKVTPSTHGSGARGGRRLTVTGGTVDLHDQMHLVRKESITAIARAWMRLIRWLDSADAARVPMDKETGLVRLVHLLGAFLSGVLDHLRPQDCEAVLSEAADVLHEYIYRCNTSSWSPLLTMPESLFAFLESRQVDSSA